jgi:hypothetical protein
MQTRALDSQSAGADGIHGRSAKVSRKVRSRNEGAPSEIRSGLFVFWGYIAIEP